MPIGVYERLPLDARFWAKVDRRDPDDCWPWTGARTTEGYGHIRVSGTRTMRMAHRVAYELMVGLIPEGLTLDHLCRTPGCVNPKHLEPVTERENILRGTAPTAVNARKTECARGHSFTAENTRTRRGHRKCRTCDRLRARRARADAREMAKAALREAHKPLVGQLDEAALASSRFRRRCCDPRGGWGYESGDAIEAGLR